MERKRRRWRWQPTPLRFSFYMLWQQRCITGWLGHNASGIFLETHLSLSDESWLVPTPCYRMLTLPVCVQHTTGQKLSGRQIVHAGNFYEEGGKAGQWHGAGSCFVCRK